MFCTKCGKEVADGAKFCTGCGAPIAAAPVMETPAAPVETPPEPVAAPAAEPFVPAYEPEPACTAPADTEPVYTEPVYAEPAAPKKKKTGIIYLAVAAVAVIAAVVTFFAWIYPSYLSKAAKLDRAENQAERALREEDYETAAAECTQALALVEKDDDDTRGDLLVLRGDAYLGAENYDAAIEDYEAALELDGDQKKLWKKLAEAYLAADDTAGAIDAYERGYDATGADSLLQACDELRAPDPDTGSVDITMPPDAPTPAGPAPDAPTTGARPETIELGGQTINTDETTISLMDCGITDISALRYCTELTWLDLDMNDITDLTPLANLTKLETIWLRENDVTDLTPLAGLPNLKYLYLSDNPGITDLTPLAKLTQLEELTLWHAGVTDLTPLAGLTNLTYLDLDETPVRDITPLFGLTQLETLFISGENLPEDAWEQIAAHLPQFDYMAPLYSSDYYDTLNIGSVLYMDDVFLREDDEGYLYGYAVDLGCALGDLFYTYGISGDYAYYGYSDLNEALNGLDSGEVDLLIVYEPDESFDNNSHFSYLYTGSADFCIVMRSEDDTTFEYVLSALDDLDSAGTLEAIYDESYG